MKERSCKQMNSHFCFFLFCFPFPLSSFPFLSFSHSHPLSPSLSPIHSSALSAALSTTTILFADLACSKRKHYRYQSWVSWTRLPKLSEKSQGHKRTKVSLVPFVMCLSWLVLSLQQPSITWVYSRQNLPDTGTSCWNQRRDRRRKEKDSMS